VMEWVEAAVFGLLFGGTIFLGAAGLGLFE
jgi:hypothetical protein